MENTLPFILAIVAITVGGLAILIPIAGLTARFALKPIVESIVRARETVGGGRELGQLERRVSILEQQVQAVESTLGRVTEARDFERKLQTPET
jgi:hypothetical protein